METTPTHPDYFYTRPTTLLIKSNTNPLYKFFRQNYFTAGDYKQFLEHWVALPFFPALEKREKEEKGLPLPEQVGWSKYKDSCVHQVFDTFMYIAEKFKKGLFVQTQQGGCLRTYLPFSKVHFTNEWFSHIQVDKKQFSSVLEMMRYVAEQEKKPFVESRVHKDVKSWYGNNGLVRLEFPTSEGDSGCNMLKDMWNTLVQERNVPNASFFVNKRDFPLLTKDGYESYRSFFGPRVPLVSHDYDRYAPVLGMTTTKDHADIPIPTWEDWCRVSYWHDKRLFAKEFRTYPTPEEFDAVPWETRRPIAVFRGASTGLGTTLANNPRLFFAAESAKKKMDVDGVPFLDAGITKWNLRPRKHPDSRYLETIRVDQMPFSLVDPRTPLEQASYKYILHLPGHSCAYRLSLELYSGSVVLLYPCEYKLWFTDALQPWVHYVPLDPTNPEDVYDKIRWCKENDETCRGIAQQARAFAHQYLSREGILDYLEKVLHSFHEIRYAPRTLTDMMEAKIKTWRSPWESHQQKMVRDPLLHHLLSTFSTDTSRFSFPLMALFLRHRWLSEGEGSWTRTMLTETKNTRVERVEVHGRGIVVKTCKKRKNDGQLPSFFAAVAGLNYLARTIPHFMYTYHMEERGEEWCTLLQHVEGPTLEMYLKGSQPSFQELVHLWLLLCLALHSAQQTMGFLHMDLYPWNVIVQTEKKPTTRVYPIDAHHSYRVATSVTPVMIDFEKSHFMHQGLHVYNTSPFRFCRLQDVISLVFSTLSMFLEYSPSLSEQDIFRILHCMNFFCSAYTQNHRFHSISHVKLFLKKHKKFSRMMYEPKTGLETKSPLDFFRHMVNSQFPYQSFSHGPQWEFIVPPQALETVSIELELLDKVYVDASSVSLEEKKITLRRYWMGVEKRLSTHSEYSGDRLGAWYRQLVRQETLHAIRHQFIEFEHRWGVKIWEHHHWDDLMGFSIVPPKEEVLAEWKKWMAASTSSPHASPRPPPFLMSPLCIECIQKSTVAPKKYTMTMISQLLYVASHLLPDRLPHVDLFALWTQDFHDEYHAFLLQGMT